MSWRENKAEWKTSAAGVFIYDSDSCCSVLLSSIAPPRGQWGARRSQSGREENDSTHWSIFFTAAISKFIEIDWFLQIIVKLILPLNTETKRGRPDWPQHQNRRLMAVKMCRDQYYQPGKKRIRTRALKICPEQNSCKNRTVFFSFWLFNTFCYKQVHDNHRYKVSIILNNIPNENKQASSATFYKSKTLWNLREKINNI